MPEEIFRTPGLMCPVCGSDNNAHATKDTQQLPPHDGDLTLCMYCTSFLRFANHMSVLEVLTPTDIANLDALTFHRLRSARKFFREHGPGKESTDEKH